MGAMPSCLGQMPRSHCIHLASPCATCIPCLGMFSSCLPSLDVPGLSDTLGKWRLWLFQLCLRSITTATILAKAPRGSVALTLSLGKSCCTMAMSPRAAMCARRAGGPAPRQGCGSSSPGPSLVWPLCWAHPPGESQLSAPCSQPWNSSLLMIFFPAKPSAGGC